MPRTKANAQTNPTPEQPGTPTDYTVVARRYRPQQFAELIGQEHVSNALVNALQSNRVAHAYLFTGARGVGKTSAARILAKALNCVQGPTPTPCDVCDSCKAVALGEDVDVLEIDGASNNKVEEIRELRQNVGFRPTRGRYKIYIIDEVHMLSTSAFNALLKTLEEPPPQVKFILATTEVQKIPITILSRCQRFDFAQVGPTKIFEQLQRIVEREGHPADDEALKLIARRANGSMRDSQSLLDQLLASTESRLTVQQVCLVLGTAGDDRVIALATSILKSDSAAALQQIEDLVDHGLNLSDILDQLIGHWRALMIGKCAGSASTSLPLTGVQQEALAAQLPQVTLDAVLAGLEVLTTTRARMRDSVHNQLLLELAVVRLARLEELLPVGQLIQLLTTTTSEPGDGTPAATRRGTGQLPVGDPVKKNHLGTTNRIQETNEVQTLAPVQLAVPENGANFTATQFQNLLEKSPILANHLQLAQPPAIFGPNSLVFRFEPRYTYAYDICSTDANVLRIKEWLQHLTGQAYTIRMELINGIAEMATTPTANQPGERRKQLMNLPIFRKASEALGAQIWHVDDEFSPQSPFGARTEKSQAQEPEEF